jgi:hypothetical protein
MMRDLMNVVALLFENKQPFAVGHNDPPKIRLVKTGKTPLGSKTYDTYDVFVGERKVGMAFGRYMPKKPGMAAGHIFRMTLKGQDFNGSKARLLAWIEKITRDDI